MSEHYGKLLTPQTLLVNEASIVYTYLGKQKIIISEKYLPDDIQLKQNGGHHTRGTTDNLYFSPDHNSFKKVTKQPISTLVDETNRIMAQSMENYLIQMVSQCAINLCYPHSKAFPSPSLMKSSLTPTLRKTVSFVDEKQSLWDSVLKYLEPVKESIMSGRKLVFATHEPAAIYYLAWNIYVLILGLRTKSQVITSPKSSSEIIKLLLRVKGLSKEAKARLAILSGVFNSYEEVSDIGGFQLRSNVSSEVFCERLEEILEDAYLLEASQLRCFISYEGNKASLKRDLRGITNYISKHRSLLKGLLKAVEFICYIHGSSIAISELLDFFPSKDYDKSSPILISPASHLMALMDNQRNRTLMVLLNCEGNSHGIHYVKKSTLDAYQDDFYQIPSHPFM